VSKLGSHFARLFLFLTHKYYLFRLIDGFQLPPEITLTTAGNTAKVCIVNGVELGYKAISLGVPYNLAVGGLGALAGMTGCGGIVDMSKIPTQDQFNQIKSMVGQ
jgi:hypothetical protein